MKNFTLKKYLSKTLLLIGGLLLMMGISHKAHSQCAVTTGPTNYCGYGDAIDSYTFNGVTATNNGCSSASGYSDFGSTPGFTAYPGKSINISASLGGGNFQQGLAIWIDYNNDGFFDSSEYVFSSFPALIVTGSLNIPTSAVSAKVKMRVMCAYWTTPAANEACMSNLGSYGETEDYDLVIMPLVPNNAAVWSVDSPSVFCAGSQDIYATIGNSGTNRIDSVNIYWEFNGVTEPMLTYTQQLDTINGTNPSSALVYLGSKNFAYGVSNNIKVWTSMPNAVADTVNLDDTMSVMKQAALTGNYTIDASLPSGSGNYTSFSSLSADLNNFGVCGPVTVVVDSGAYNDYIYLNNVEGVSSINTITIDGQDSSKVSLIHDGSIRWATVTLDNTGYVTIKNMHIQNTHSYDGAAFYVEGGSSYFKLLNSHLEVDKYAGSWTLNNIMVSGTANYSHIENNTVSGGSGGIRMGDWSSSSNVGNRIVNNEIININEIGLEAYNQDSLIVNKNTIEVYEMANTWSTGVRMISSNNYLFHENNVKARNMALSIDNFSSVGVMNRERSIVNNMLIADEYGVQMYNVDSVYFHHNSVSTKTNTVWQIYDFGSGIANYDVRNNILSSEYGRAIYTESTSSIFDQLDNNLYYTKKGSILFSVSLVDYADLVSFQSAASSLNVSSLEGDPQFLSPINDLHVVGVLASEAGDNTLNITVDIDGDTRPLSAATSVDIGADEYDLPSCPPPYQLEAYKPGLDSISLQWVGGSGGDYQIEIVPKGNAQGTGDTISSTAQSIRIGNLTPSTGYEFYVRKICARGDTSMWWGPTEFYTASKVVYFEDFETFSLPMLTNSWTSSTFSDPQWVSGDYSNYGAITKDHTIGAGGIFAFMQTWNSWQPGTSDLLSTFIYVDSNYKNIEFSFWYYMNGTDMGDLNVYVDTNGVSNLITTISGQQQLSNSEPWLEFSTFLSGYEGKMIQLRFQGSKGNGSYSEIGLDDIRVDTVPEFNVGVINLISPDEEICPGTITPIVGVRNLGSTSIDSVKVIWEINGVVMDSVMYSTTILSGDTAAVTLGNITLNSTGIYDIKFYTKDPNSSSDPFPVDDTLKIENLRTGLSGTYSIDPSSPASLSNFIDFKSVVDVLEMSGVCGPTTINVSSGTYYESILLKQIDGMSSVNTLLFDGADSSTTIISHDGSVNFATWTFDGADYITLKNLGIECTNWEGGTILFANASDHNTITNCNLLVDTFSSSNWSLQNILISSSTSTNNWGGYSSYNTIANNEIIGGYYAINFEGSDVNRNVGNRILNNNIDNAYYYGVYAYYQDSLEIIGNNINMWTQSNTYSNAIQISSANNSIISSNFILGTYTGIAYYNWGGASPSNRRKLISNNMIIMESSDMWGGTALTMQEVDSIDIYHNSIQINSAGNSAALVAYAWSITLADLDLRNNIISSNYSPTLDIGSSLAAFSFMDNNNYYSEGGTLAIIDGIDYYTLSDIQSLNAAMNLNSIEGNPQYASSTDLHIIGNFVDNKGDNTVGIAVDIDGDARPYSGSTTVDIGADEFDPPSCPPVINMQALNALANSIDLQWEGGLGDFEYEIVFKDSALGSGTSAITVFDSLTVGGLDPSTEYEFYVREICARGDTSIWWGPISFKTITPVYDMMISRIAAPVSQSDSCYSSNESVSIVLINNGNVEMDFGMDTTDVWVNVTGAATQNYTYQLKDNSLNGGLLLAAGDSLQINLGNLDMSSVGSYNLEGILSMGSDVSAVNDTLRRSVLNATSGGSLSSNMQVCGSGNVILSTNGSMGDIQWQRLVGSFFADELNADSSSYEVFVDSTVSFRAVACGIAFSDTLTMVPQAVPSMPTIVNDTAIVFCGDSGTALLTASTSISGSINWYEDTAATFVLSTGSSFNYGLSTSPQTITTTYADTFYVSVVDGITLCESELAMAIGTVICTVGEEEMPSALSGISIQPNPSKGTFHLIGMNIKEEMNILVYNSNGKIIYEVDEKLIGNFDKRIDLSDFSKGIYFVKIQNEGAVQMKKIVIQ